MQWSNDEMISVTQVKGSINYLLRTKMMMMLEMMLTIMMKGMKTP